MPALRRRSLVAAAATIVLLTAATALATVPVPPLDPGERFEPLDAPATRTLPPDLGPFNYLRELDQIVAFLARWQVDDPADPDYGGMIEAESGDLGGVIQTDNTLEAIWVWSRYRELTGRTTYDANIAAAWDYCLTYPAWLEEGSAGDDYYRVHNCAWGLTAVLQYAAATGDASFNGYAASCAAYIRSHSLNLSVADTWAQRLRAFCKGWAAGNLFLYAEATSDATLRTSALSQGQDVLAWLNVAPSVRLGWEYWAMSAGTCVWGVCNSVFRDDPAAGAAWIATNGGFLDVWQDWYSVPGYDWDGAWNVAYANGQYAMHDVTGDDAWFANGVFVTDALLSLDTDDDGGIKAETIDLDREDMTWVTSYLAKFCLDRLIGTPPQHDVGVLRFVGLDDGDVFDIGTPIPVRILATNFGLAAETGVTVTLAGDWGPAVVVRDLAFAALDTDTIDPAWLPDGAGSYTLSAATSLAGDENAGNDAVTVTVHYGNASAVPGDDVFAAAPPRATVTPFAATTGVSFALAQPAAAARVAVFDLRGREVALLHDGALAAGPHVVTWDGRAAPAGVYLVQVRVGAAAYAVKLVKAR